MRLGLEISVYESLHHVYNGVKVIVCVCGGGAVFLSVIGLHSQKIFIRIIVGFFQLLTVEWERNVNFDALYHFIEH